jgi:hypothetical protein
MIRIIFGLAIPKAFGFEAATPCPQPAGDISAARAEVAVRFRNWRRLIFSILFPHEVPLIFFNNIITAKVWKRNKSFGIV